MPGEAALSDPVPDLAEIEGLRAALEQLEKASTLVARYGAQTGPQWTTLAGALITARVALDAARLAPRDGGRS